MDLKHRVIVNKLRETAVKVRALNDAEVPTKFNDLASCLDAKERKWMSDFLTAHDARIAECEKLSPEEGEKRFIRERREFHNDPLKAKNPTDAAKIKNEYFNRRLGLRLQFAFTWADGYFEIMPKAISKIIEAAHTEIKAEHDIQVKSSERWGIQAIQPTPAIIALLKLCQNLENDIHQIERDKASTPCRPFHVGAFPSLQFPTTLRNILGL
jgi:hypothetical protein